MKVLLDTCVLSELKQKAPNPLVQAYIANLSDESIFISAITIGEIAKGISLLDSGKRKAELQSWLDALESDYAENIVPISSDVCRIWGEISAKCQKSEQSIPALDGLIAAMAIHHGLHLVTRNVSDFQASGALLVNPWET